VLLQRLLAKSRCGLYKAGQRLCFECWLIPAAAAAVGLISHCYSKELTGASSSAWQLPWHGMLCCGSGNRRQRSCQWSSRELPAASTGFCCSTWSTGVNWLSHVFAALLLQLCGSRASQYEGSSNTQH
jgi:hypothetical protein